MTAPSAIRPLAAAHFTDALTAAADQQPTAALAALMRIDPQSWTAIEQRCAALGTSVIDAIAFATRHGGTTP
ncbi:hypothetical protein [Kitasatospora sp. NBC_01302]|uniref:hypothetical protein n=1 Tax=Kitasatospora sp. NBC_01302 TaxID=2903575 RepID=UPI002E109F38|nr:hypothetical protein OG294_19635 [Kitasatospora sp. NBC_01302]